MIQVPVHSNLPPESQQRNHELAQRLDEESRRYTGRFLLQTGHKLLQLEQLTAKAHRDHQLKLKQQRARCENEKVEAVVTKHRLEQQLRRSQLEELVQRKQRLAHELRESLLLFKQANADLLAGEGHHDLLVHEMAEKERTREEHLAEHLVERQTTAAMNRQSQLDQIREKASHEMHHAKEVTEHRRQLEEHIENVMRSTQNQSLERSEQKRESILHERATRASDENEQVRNKHLDVLFNRNPQLGQALTRVVQCELELTRLIQQSFLTDFKLNDLHQVLENEEQLHTALSQYLEMRAADDASHSQHLHEEQTSYWQPPQQQQQQPEVAEIASTTTTTTVAAEAGTDGLNQLCENVATIIPPSSTVSESGSVADMTSIEVEGIPNRWPDDDDEGEYDNANLHQQASDDDFDEESELRNQYDLDGDDTYAIGSHAGRSGHHAMSIDKLIRRLDKICHHKRNK